MIVEAGPPIGYVRKKFNHANERKPDDARVDLPDCLGFSSKRSFLTTTVIARRAFFARRSNLITKPALRLLRKVRSQ